MLLRNFELLCSVIKRVKSRQILNRFCKNAALLRVQDAGMLLLIKITCFHFHWEFSICHRQVGKRIVHTGLILPGEKAEKLKLKITVAISLASSFYDMKSPS